MEKYIEFGCNYRNGDTLVRSICKAIDKTSGKPVVVYGTIEKGYVKELYTLPMAQFKEIFLREQFNG